MGAFQSFFPPRPMNSKIDEHTVLNIFFDFARDDLNMIGKDFYLLRKIKVYKLERSPFSSKWDIEVEINVNANFSGMLDCLLWFSYARTKWAWRQRFPKFFSPVHVFKTFHPFHLITLAKRYAGENWSLTNPAFITWKDRFVFPTAKSYIPTH